MQPDRRATADATPDGDASRSASVQHAVEQFIELHAAGTAPDLKAYCQRFPDDLREQVLAQCREFLAFDGLLGHQPFEPKPEAEAEGRVFGDFVIQEELGRGGMGVVYLAKQRSLNRRIALKVMASGLTLSKRHVERFRREAAATAQLRHPAIVAVHSLTEVDGTFALAMDYVAGRNLADMLDDLRLANGERPGVVEGTLGLDSELGYVAECATFCAQLASALAAAHQAGVVHRDLKPRNLMVDDHHQVRLLDFGLAKSLGEGSLSMSGEITGTAHYMSPEQTLAKRVEVDHRADIWALGVILYELMTLERPFDGKNLQQIVYEICFKEPVSPHRRNPKVPRDLVTICQKALEKDPQNRYQSAAEFEADLLRFLRWEPIHARPAGPLSRASKFVRRHRTAAVVVGTLLVVVVVALVVVARQNADRDRRHASLMESARSAATAGDYRAAIAAVNQALELRSDEATISRLDQYQAEDKRNATEALSKVAKSKQLMDYDREGAIQLALDAERMLSSSETRSAVLDALGSGCSARTLAARKAGRTVPCTGAAWAGDSTHLVTIGYDGLPRLWHAGTGEVVRTLEGHAPSPLVDVTFAAGDRFLTASSDRTLRAWNLAGDALYTVHLPGQAWGTRCNADGTRVLVVTYDYDEKRFLAQVRETAHGEPVSPEVLHKGLIVAAELSPDGTLAATASGEHGSVRLWRVADGTTVATCSEHAEQGHALRALTFSPDGAYCAIADDGGSVRFYRTADGTLAGSIEQPKAVTSLAFAADGLRLLTGSTDLTARLWQLHRSDDGAVQAHEVATMVGHTGPVQCVAFDPTGQLVLTAGGEQDGGLRVFDVHGGRAVHTYEVGPAIGLAHFSPDGRSVLAVAQKGRVVVWDFGSTRGVVTMRQPGSVPAARFDRTGERLVTAGDDERLRLWQTQDGRPLWTSKPLGNPIVALDVDAAGERVACVTVTDGIVHVLRLRDGTPLFELGPERAGPAHAGRGPDPIVQFVGTGDRLLTTTATATGGDVVAWNTNDQSVAWRLARPKGLIAATVNRDGSLLATVDDGADRALLWRLPTLAAAGEIVGHGAVLAIAFAPDRDALLLAGRDGTATLHSLDGTALTRFEAGVPLQAATFSRDGRLLLTSSSGTAEARLWNADGTELVRFHGHRRPVRSVAFSDDARWCATAANDGTTCLWPTDPVATAGRLSARNVPDGNPPDGNGTSNDPASSPSRNR